MSVKEFTVIESKWLRGARDGKRQFTPSCLLNEDGSMCCMGFLAKACGVPLVVREETMYFSSVNFIGFDHLLPETLRPRFDGVDDRGHGELALNIYTVNDETRITDEERKSLLTKYFADAGVTVRFVP